MTREKQPEDPLRELQQRGRILERLLDDRGRIARWPRRWRDRYILIDFILAHFEAGEVLTETQVNARLDSLHAFGDAAMLRRLLVDLGHLARVSDGSAYWRTPPE